MNIPPYGENYRKINQPFASLKAQPKADPDMTVYVTPGMTILNGKNFIEYGGGSTSELTVPSNNNARWDIICLNNSGYLEIINGTPGTEPQAPIVPRNKFPIALVYLTSTTNKITTENLFDIRPGFANSIYSHNDLSNRNDVNAHPIDAISGLQAALDSKLDDNDLGNQLDNKADADGTPTSTFTLNKDLTESPNSNAVFEVERGTATNVNIRFNESNNQWEYTNDGSNYAAFGMGGSQENFTTDLKNKLEGVEANAISDYPFTTVIFVDGNNGSDSDGSGSQPKPFATINKAINVANGTRAIIQLNPAYYTEDFTLPNNVNIRGCGLEDITPIKGNLTVGKSTISHVLIRESTLTINDTTNFVHCWATNLGVTVNSGGLYGLNFTIKNDTLASTMFNIVGGEVTLTDSFIESTVDQYVIDQTGGSIQLNMVQLSGNRPSNNIINSSSGVFKAMSSGLVNTGGTAVANLANGASMSNPNGLSGVLTNGAITCGTASTIVDGVTGGAVSGDNLLMRSSTKIAYTPSTSSDWDTTPANLKAALDELAGRVRTLESA